MLLQQRHHLHKFERRCKGCGALLDTPDATICLEYKINRLQKAQAVLEAASDLCYSLSDAIKPGSSGTGEFVYEFEDDVVKFHYCHWVRDGKAMYCRHYNDST